MDVRTESSNLAGKRLARETRQVATVLIADYSAEYSYGTRLKTNRSQASTCILKHESLS